MISEAFALTAELCLAMNAAPVNQHSGCWELAVDDHWFLAFNGHNVPVNCSKSAKVPPFTIYIEYNGWPAGVVDPVGGTMAAGDCANENAFLDALRARIAAEQRRGVA
jgi:hypothetical protein